MHGHFVWKLSILDISKMSWALPQHNKKDSWIETNLKMGADICCQFKWGKMYGKCVLHVDNGCVMYSNKIDSLFARWKYFLIETREQFLALNKEIRRCSAIISFQKALPVLFDFLSCLLIMDPSDSRQKLFPRLLAGIHIQLHQSATGSSNKKAEESSWIKSTVFLCIDDKVILLELVCDFFSTTHVFSL